MAVSVGIGRYVKCGCCQELPISGPGKEMPNTSLVYGSPLNVCVCFFFYTVVVSGLEVGLGFHL